VVEEDLFIFNYDIEGPRTPFLSQGVSLQHDQSEGCDQAAPLSGGRIIRLCLSCLPDNPPTHF
jgi:hypothetical protein